MQETSLDRWQIALQEQKTALEKCQTEQHLTSCMQCPKILDCTIRDAYVKAVYDSMNKGQGGGFEF